MKLTSRLRLTCTGSLIMALAAGCSSSPADGQTSPPSTSVTASASVIDPSSATPSSSDPGTTPSDPGPSIPVAESTDSNAREAVDRAAAEAAWARFWNVSDNLWRVPLADRPAAAAQVAVEPTYSQILNQASQFELDGVESYGSPIFHPYWQQDIAGADLAVMGDCTDASQTGSMISATGQKTTVGVSDNNTRVTLVRGPDGQWRVEKIFYLLDVPCP